jgi:hypothetical protein
VASRLYLTLEIVSTTSFHIAGALTIGSVLFDFIEIEKMKRDRYTMDNYRR